ncbi:hypothetical protein DIS24_g8123 [Lasiodiplodia hormozganensis]|uniref:Protein kinase domain-containing protein n=1 Tax=Lasiodiplodia hormozganensis TaxID=869390 RepID=A0AA39Y399_9PEZI|nr:hypothetical protein DIS24_g8123 [Lasiodiplodia hormozganensis]
MAPPAGVASAFSPASALLVHDEGEKGSLTGTASIVPAAVSGRLTMMMMMMSAAAMQHRCSFSRVCGTASPSSEREVQVPARIGGAAGLQQVNTSRMAGVVTTDDGTQVLALHKAGIVWGDVNPHNIVIDDRSAAWVVDFGGECNVEFVDEENKEKSEGDWQGWQRVFDIWLPARGSAATVPSER